MTEQIVRCPKCNELRKTFVRFDPFGRPRKAITCCGKTVRIQPEAKR